MWPRNELTDRLKLQWPILQAPMGSYTTPALAAEVSNAGGLGGLGMFGLDAEDAARRIAGFRQQSGGSLNVNYLLFDMPSDLTGLGAPMRAGLGDLYEAKGIGPVPEPKVSVGAIDPEQLAMLLDAKPEVVSFHFGLPDTETLRAIKQAGCYILSSATTVAEARALETAGADAVIAQGLEAGGHRATHGGAAIEQQPGLFALLPQIVDAVSIPVVAAGGIADGRGIAAAIMLGASAVQLGTAFLRCAEANVSDPYRAALSNGSDDNTVVTTLASGKPARMVRNKLIDNLAAIGDDPLPFPAQLGLTMPLGTGGDAEMSVLFSGQSAALTRDLPAAELVTTLAEETTARLLWGHNI